MSDTVPNMGGKGVISGAKPNQVAQVLKMNEEQGAPAPHSPLLRKRSCLQHLDSSVYKRSVSIPPNPTQTYAFSLTSQPHKRSTLPN